MTGKELIIYILENDLLDKSMFDCDNVVGLLSVSEAAIALGAGNATILAHIKIGTIDTVRVGKMDFVIDNDKFKKLKGRRNDGKQII